MTSSFSFRVATDAARADSGLYWNALGVGRVEEMYLSSASVGFGLVGLCFDAKMGRTPTAAAALQLQETLVAFDAFWWPTCIEVDGWLCPHWLQHDHSHYSPRSSSGFRC